MLCYAAAWSLESKRNSGTWSLRPGWLQVSDCFVVWVVCVAAHAALTRNEKLRILTLEENGKYNHDICIFEGILLTLKVELLLHAPLVVGIQTQVL